MKVARRLKEENIAEYLIYMWHTEDLIRANGCDADRVYANFVLRYPEEERAALKEWYDNLTGMMHAEGVTERGHLQINRNVMLDLTDLHAALLSSARYPSYNAAYFKALPFIVELRRKNGKVGESELETCFEALYGVLLLRLRKKEISPGTSRAVKAISGFLSMLAAFYARERKGELEDL